MSNDTISEVTDVDLPVVAALAALELGREMRGEKTDLENVKNVAKIFSRPSYLLNMPKIFVRSRAESAVEDWGQSITLQTYADLQVLVERVVRAASSQDEQRDMQVLNRLKKFCGAVSDHAIANRMARDETIRPDYQRLR